MGDPEWAHEEIFQDRLARGRNADALYALMQEWISALETQELYHEAQRRRIPFAAVNNMNDLYANEHLAERGFFAELESARPREASRCPAHLRNTQAAGRCALPRRDWANITRTTRWQKNPPAPAVSSRNLVAGGASEAKRELPLAGIRVLDFTWAWAGPFCTLQLAHLGAEVIRIETAKRVCVTRGCLPSPTTLPGPNRAGYFNQYNQGKRSITTEFVPKPEAIEIALELARHCDVVTDNFAAGVMDRLGLGYEKIRAHRPDFVMLSMSGYGQTGPLQGLRQLRTAGGSAMRVSSSLTGYEGTARARSEFPMPIRNAGIFGAVAVMVALLHRKRTGRGQYIDQSQLETALALLPEGLLEYAMNGTQPRRIGNRASLDGAAQLLQSAGRRRQMGERSRSAPKRVARAVPGDGQPALADDPRFRSAASAQTERRRARRDHHQWTAARDRWDITRELQRAGVAAFPSMSNKDLADQRASAERGFLVAVGASGGRPPHPHRNPVDDVGDALPRSARRAIARRRYRFGA